MKKLKHILSGSLLLVYLISFVHALVPHHHHLSENESCSLIKHEVCENDLHEEKAHLHHESESLLEYLSCLLGNINHNHDAEISNIPFNQKRGVEVVDFYIPDIACFNEFNPQSISVEKKVFKTYHFSFSRRDIHSVHLLRGPPQFS